MKTPMRSDLQNNLNGHLHNERDQKTQDISRESEIVTRLNSMIGYSGGSLLPDNITEEQVSIIKKYFSK